MPSVDATAAGHLIELSVGHLGRRRQHQMRGLHLVLVGDEIEISRQLDADPFPDRGVR
ncbi:MAG: hypothetical protein OXQ86_09025 [Gammaproteobacteria bacterium]|nr:hypothetical protein [Gammaproteobacteria bacterium]MDE0413996.1 hypothetical protein [Gammaproteobacteria bacterium]